MANYESPALKKDAFHCPYDNAFAHQRWFELAYIYPGGSQELGSGMVSICQHCKKVAIWLGDTMIWPPQNSAPLPHQDLPDILTSDYEEACLIHIQSPRGAAALLRLLIQKLCLILGENGKNLNDAIASLAKKGMPVEIQKALDIVRVIGNEAVHPGVIDVKDDAETVGLLFDLVNTIVENRISAPKRIEEMYAKLPPEKLQQIEHRDKIKP